jgi:hypothetical protein
VEEMVAPTLAALKLQEPDYEKNLKHFKNKQSKQIEWHLKFGTYASITACVRVL